MTESTTIEAPPPRVEVSRIAVEDDATPVVRLVGRTLRDAVAAAGAGAGPVAGLHGAVAVRSHDTPQAATVTIAGDVVEVTSGVFIEPDATVVVDLDARFAPVEEPTGDVALAAALLRALRATRPPASGRSRAGCRASRTSWSSTPPDRTAASTAASGRVRRPTGSQDRPTSSPASSAARTTSSSPWPRACRSRAPCRSCPS